MIAPALRAVLERAQELGFIGAAPLELHVEHALAFARALGSPVSGHCVDLGTGGGLPGLVLADHWRDTTWLMLDGSVKRMAVLAEGVAALGWEARMIVQAARAEEVGRSASAREAAVLVTARGFGPPAVTAECAAPLLSVGGHLIVSEPPGGAPDRWPAAELGRLGLEVDRVVVGPPAFVVLVQARPCPDAYPRRTGIPAKRPLFGPKPSDGPPENRPL